MRRVVILPAAEEDLDHIFAHTARTWSEEQAMRYLDLLEDSLSALAHRPSLARLCESLRPGLRRQLVKSHVVYFLADEEELTVVRVLHKSMLPERHAF